MASTIVTEDCIGCGNCEPECPNGAVSQSGDVYVIDPELCDDCLDTGGCAGVEICPTEAIVAAAAAVIPTAVAATA